MKRILGIVMSVLFVLSFLFVPFSSAGEPYAPVHKFKDKEFKGAFGMTLKEAKEMELWPPVMEGEVPDKSAVAAPFYPGAEIVDLKGPVRIRKGGKFINKGLSTMELVSKDPFEKVVSFYTEKLKGWKIKKYQNSQYFAKSGKVEDNSKAMKVPHVGISKIEGLMNKSKYTALVPGTKSVISVNFEQKK
jgi:hypothetical protein